MFPIDQNLQDGQGAESVKAAVAAAIAGRVGRFDGGVLLVAVSKTRPIGDIKHAFLNGLRHFGENYVQESVEKITALADLRIDQVDGIIQWHLIGPLQSNKAKLAATHFDWVQTVAGEKIANLLHAHRPDSSAPLNVLIQVNISGETAKSGTRPNAISTLANHILKLPRLRLRGLMAIVENVSEESILRHQYGQMRQLFDETQKNHPQFDTLSMGMSQDYTIAIDEGATMVRVGSAIFGARATVHG